VSEAVSVVPPSVSSESASESACLLHTTGSDHSIIEEKKDELHTDFSPVKLSKAQKKRVGRKRNEERSEKR